MKVSTIAILAALGFSSMSSASGGYLSSCQNLSIEGLEGDPGRALLMRAECKDINGNYKKSVLDLNTCFGRGADCEISYPGTYDPTLAALAQTYLSHRQAQACCEHGLMAVSCRNLTGACNYCDNKWRHEARFGKRFCESCDLSRVGRC